MSFKATQEVRRDRFTYTEPASPARERNVLVAPWQWDVDVPYKVRRGDEEYEFLLSFTVNCDFHSNVDAEFRPPAIAEQGAVPDQAWPDHFDIRHAGEIAIRIAMRRRAEYLYGE